MEGLRRYHNDTVHLDRKSPSSSSSTTPPTNLSVEESTETKIQRLISEHPLIIFSRSSCCMCHVMRRLLLTIGVHPTVIELDDHDISALPPTSSHDNDDSPRNPVAPAVFIGGTCVGGLESLVALHLNGHLVPKLVEVGALRDLTGSYLDKNLKEKPFDSIENASGERGILHERARNPNLRFRSRSKQVIDHEDAVVISQEEGKLQSAVPVPNHEYQMASLDFSVSEGVSIWSILQRVLRGYHGFCLGGQYQRAFAITFFVLEAISYLQYLLTGDFPSYFLLFLEILSLIGIIMKAIAPTTGSINRHSYLLEMFFSFVQLIVTCSHFLLVFKNEWLNFIASVFPLVYAIILVVWFGFKKEPSQDYHKPSDPDDLHLQIDEDHHESFESDFLRRSPDDLASRVSEMDRQILQHDQSQDIQGEDEDKDGKLPGNKRSLVLYLHRKYKKRALAVLYLILEAISFVLDFIGKGKVDFTVAAFLLALLVFILTFWVYINERSTRLPVERPIAGVEFVFSVIQLLSTLLHLILSVMGLNNMYNVSVLPLAFAVLVVVFAFRKEHEKGIHNAAEPPAENQVNQHDGLQNIMVHMTVTGMRLNTVIDLTMVTCYEQLFRKLGDEMFKAEKELWGDRPRWDVFYLDISNEVHYLREDKLPWDEFCMAARKICIYRKEVVNQLYRRWESMPRTSEKGSERLLFT